MIRSVLLAGCGWLRKQLDLVERLAQQRDNRHRKAQLGDRCVVAQDAAAQAHTHAACERYVADAAANARTQYSSAVDHRSLGSSQQSNLAAQILDRVSHVSSSLETRQSDTVLTVPEGRQA